MCSEWLKVNGRERFGASRAELTPAQALEKYEKLSATSPLDMFGNPKPYYDPAAKPPRPTDLFGEPIPEPKRARRSKRTQQRGPHQRHATKRPCTPSSAPPAPPKKAEGVLPLVRNVTDEEVASFKALGVEVCIESARVGDIWLVPEYQNENRRELRIDHAATLSVVCSAFPGAKIVSFEKVSPAEADAAD
jgi:hypothetical protein